MTTEILFIVEESIEGGFQARAIAHSIYTEAETLEEIRCVVKDAVLCHFDELERPKFIRLHIAKDEVMLEVAQQMAYHESARTAGLYDRRNDQVLLDEVERILI